MIAYKNYSRFLNQKLIFGCRRFIASLYEDIEIPKETIAETFFRFTSFNPNNIAYINSANNRSYTYADTKNAINGIASALTKKGFKPGTMAGIIATNCAEYLMLIFALSSMGCSVTICNHNYTKTEMEYQLGDSNPSIIFTDTINLEKVVDVASNVISIKDIFLLDERRPSYGYVQDLMEDCGNMSPIGQIDIDIDNHVALMPYSSGTTGLPKGVMLTHRNLVANMLQMSIGHAITGRQTMIINLPLYHIYASMIISTMAFMSGSRIIVQPKFESIPFLRAIQDYKATVLHLVPPQVLFFINHPEVAKYDLSSVTKCMCAAAPLDVVVEQRFNDKFKVHQSEFQIFQGYGLSETSPVSHLGNDHRIHVAKSGSVGLLVPNMKCKVVDVLTREEVPANVKGEILFQGPNVMKGYFGKSGATEKAFENGWFLSGDIGYYDDDQYFFISDRIKELIKVKGFQVAPAELEGLLLSLDAVSDCAVVGTPDEKFGEVPRAFIVKSKDITEKEIHDFVSEHLSEHKHLKGGVVFVDEIPKSPSGKILRRLLKRK